MERVYIFLPSILILAFIAGATFLYLKMIVKHFGKNFKSVEWHEKNKQKVAWIVGTPLTNVLAPAIEELVFRAPLIIAFSAMSSFAWYGIFASSGLFALMHWFGKKIWMPEILSAREKSESKTDDVEKEIDRLSQKQKGDIVVRRILHVVITLPLSILCGYYGIKYQSIWVSFGIHSAWNLIMPTVLTILVTICMLVYFGIRDKYRYSKYGK